MEGISRAVYSTVLAAMVERRHGCPLPSSVRERVTLAGVTA